MRRLFAASAASTTLILLACSAFDSDGDGDVDPPKEDARAATDAATEPSDVAADALPPVPQACTTEKAFDTPQPVKNLPPGATCFSLSPDEKTAYYHLGLNPYSAPWSFEDGVGAPSEISVERFTGNVLGCLVLTPDKSIAFVEDTFHVDRQRRLADGGYSGLEFLTAESLGDASGLFLGQPFIDRVMNQLYVHAFAGDFLNGTGPVKIARAVILPDGKTTPFTLVPLPNEDRVEAPVLTGDSLAMYYAAWHKAGDASVDFDIWVSTRKSTFDAFDTAAPVPNVSKPGAVDVPTYISNDGCHLFFASSRDKAGTGQETSSYVATRHP